MLTSPMKAYIPHSAHRKIKYDTADRDLISEYFTGFVEKVNAVSRARRINAPPFNQWYQSRYCEAFSPYFFYGGTHFITIFISTRKR
ncbi:hypothetical protein DEGADCKI_00762 [[Clostridium] scindens]|nr:hypothetical protein DEGADCKI_00762 [[Clostridium] scindens]